MNIYNGQELEQKLKQVLTDGKFAEFAEECTNSAIQKVLNQQIERFKKSIEGKVSKKTKEPVPPYVVVLKRITAMHSVFMKCAASGAVGDSYDKAWEPFLKFMIDFYNSLEKDSKNNDEVKKVLGGTVGAASGNNVWAKIEKLEEEAKKQYGSV